MYFIQQSFKFQSLWESKYGASLFKESANYWKKVKYLISFLLIGQLQFSLLATIDNSLRFFRFLIRLWRDITTIACCHAGFGGQ